VTATNQFHLSILSFMKSVFVFVCVCARMCIARVGVCLRMCGMCLFNTIVESTKTKT